MITRGTSQLRFPSRWGRQGGNQAAGSENNAALATFDEGRELPDQGSNLEPSG